MIPQSLDTPTQSPLLKLKKKTNNPKDFKAKGPNNTSFRGLNNNAH